LAKPLAGVILGTAVGDALGLPREGLSRRRAQRLLGAPPLRHRFVFGRGMVSDDTELTCFVGQALLTSSGDPERFARALAWQLRLWLLGLPAGIGLATLRSILKLWLGWPPSRSGVFSAGNGPAMRAALLGVRLGTDRDALRAHVRASTRLTHTDPRAERGALLVALAAYHGATHGPAANLTESFLALARAEIGAADAQLAGLLDQIELHLQQQAPATKLAETLNLRRGVSGYIYHTFPIALYCWLRYPGNFRQAVEHVIALGGDTDTTGAIVGALAGATVGAEGIPSEWIDGLIEWPRSVAWMRSLASRLADQGGPPSYFWPGLLVRNPLFLLLVLLHGFRRMLPPY
jgi:ADP-ribosylglycohydrolase